ASAARASCPPERVPPPARSCARYPTASDGGVRRTRPESGSSSPARRRSSVDLPAPFGPTSPIRARGGTTRLTSARTISAPYDFEIPAATSEPARRDMRDLHAERDRKLAGGQSRIDGAWAPRATLAIAHGKDEDGAVLLED